jgi:hypothetical protein
MFFRAKPDLRHENGHSCGKRKEFSSLLRIVRAARNRGDEAQENRRQNRPCLSKRRKYDWQDLGEGG